MIVSRPHGVVSGPCSPRNNAIVSSRLEGSGCECSVGGNEEDSQNRLEERIRKVEIRESIKEELVIGCNEVEKIESSSRCICSDVNKSEMSNDEREADSVLCRIGRTRSVKASMKNRKQKLKSSLKMTKDGSERCWSIGQHTERRVRGLWNPKCVCLFSRLHDEVMIDHVFSFLAFSDLLTALEVSKRWQYCANHSHCWKQIDVSDSLENACVVNHIARHAADINGLSVRAVEHQLTPHFALMGVGSCTSLQELHISSYASLEDSHVNLMLTMKKPHLTVLRLEQCPGLTDLSVKHIAFHCPNLRTLSLHGCSGITNNCIPFLKPRLLTASPLYTLVKNPTSFTSMFSPLHLPPLSTPSPKTLTTDGKLTSLDFSRTKLDPNGVISLFSSNSFTQFRINNFKFSGTGESWSNSHLRQLPAKIFIQGLLEFDISFSNPFLPAGIVTDAGIHALVSALHNKMALQKLNLSGHARITGAGIAMLISSTPQLKYLNLGGCQGILNSLHYFTAELPNLTFLTHLLLWRCFAKKNPHTTQHIRATVFDFITAICNGPSYLILQELDLDGCYFIDHEMVQLIKTKCTSLRKDGLRLRGTTFFDMKNSKPDNSPFIDIQLN